MGALSLRCPPPEPAAASIRLRVLSLGVQSTTLAVYGIETYAVEAADRAEARGIALRRSEDSPCDDARIPDRRRTVRVRRSVTTAR
ncbi:hypothetical protein [Azospirillum argentinense]|uniref:hypothetical protein n=1 Tax=Azospirillum argentinense TaxID=2970906 RepID=UPI0032DEA377